MLLESGFSHPRTKLPAFARSSSTVPAKGRTLARGRQGRHLQPIRIEGGDMAARPQDSDQKTIKTARQPRPPLKHENAPLMRALRSIAALPPADAETVFREYLMKLIRDDAIALDNTFIKLTQQMTFKEKDEKSSSNSSDADTPLSVEDIAVAILDLLSPSIDSPQDHLFYIRQRLNAHGAYS